LRIAYVLELAREVVRKGARGGDRFHGREPHGLRERFDRADAEPQRIDFESERVQALDDRRRDERQLLGPGGGRRAHGEHATLEAHRARAARDAVAHRVVPRPRREG